MRKIFHEHLPQRGKFINWKDSIGYKVKFIYDDIEGEVEIVDYNLTKGQPYIFLKYLNKPPFKIHSKGFVKCALGKLLSTYTGEFKFEIGQNLKDDKRDIVIIGTEYKNQYIKNNKNKKIWKLYKYKCSKCGYAEGWLREDHLLRGVGCSCCQGLTVVEGINDITTTAPWMVKFFQGGYEEAKLYTRTSSQKIKPICPVCGRIRNKEKRIRDIYNQQSIGCFCSDKISYPEKIMYSVLEQLGIDFINQLTNGDIKWCKRYRYDFYLTEHNTIIEVHGIQHYDEINYKRKRRLEEHENDKLKEQLAMENGIENYVVIDCRKSELEFIKNNILKSEFANIYDLSNIDWKECREFALSSLVKTVCEMKRDNPKMTTKEISKNLRLCRPTVTKYLKQGTKVWDWANYNPKEEARVSNSKQGIKKRKPVEIFKNNKSLGEFISCLELDEKSEELFGIKLNYKSISAVASGVRPHYKGFKFKYI